MIACSGGESSECGKLGVAANCRTHIGLAIRIPVFSITDGPESSLLPS